MFHPLCATTIFLPIISARVQGHKRVSIITFLRVLSNFHLLHKNFQVPSALHTPPGCQPHAVIYLEHLTHLSAIHTTSNETRQRFYNQARFLQGFFLARNTKNIMHIFELLHLVIILREKDSHTSGVGATQPVQTQTLLGQAAWRLP